MMLAALMAAVPDFFSRLAGPPDEPAALGSLLFFKRAYSTSNDGSIMSWASLVRTASHVLGAAAPCAGGHPCPNSPQSYVSNLHPCVIQVLTAVLELMSLASVRFVCKRKGGAKLYAQGILCNFVNNAFLGPPLCAYAPRPPRSPPPAALPATLCVAGMSSSLTVGCRRPSRRSAVPQHVRSCPLTACCPRASCGRTLQAPGCATHEGTSHRAARCRPGPHGGLRCGRETPARVADAAAFRPPRRRDGLRRALGP